MKLRKLLHAVPGLNVKGSRDTAHLAKEIEITGLTSNSKQVAPGHLFIAKPGRAHQGSDFIGEAAAAGAAAVVTDVYNPFLRGPIQLIHPDPAAIEPALAACYYGYAHRELALIGITGTNGKTTTSYLVRHLLEAHGTPTGLIGTIEWIAGKSRFVPTLTTPDLIVNHKLFHEMVQQGCRAAVMEVSSHALDQGRVRGLDYEIAIFTNLTLDHLDYHGTMEAYAEAKARLFASLAPSRWALVNGDSPWADRMVRDCRASILRYGFREGLELRASDIQLSPKGMQFKVAYQGSELLCISHLIGRFNAYNCLAAIGVGLVRGLSLAASVEALRSFKAVAGRLERVAAPVPFHIYVDYAHTDDALDHVLEALKEIKRARIITVFGCGGSRDASKRPKMAQAAERHSDLIVLTSDNPRHEDPESILRAAAAGFHSMERVVVEIDRKSAIERAVRAAQKEDIVLIAGKGHETYQAFAHKTIDFDDRTVALEACRELL